MYVELQKAKGEDGRKSLGAEAMAKAKAIILRAGGMTAF
jgi:hypothetical protein